MPDLFTERAVLNQAREDLLRRANVLATIQGQGQGQGELEPGVRKSGRTTGQTSGIIEQVDVNMECGGGRVARFTDQLLAGPMSQGGDSGSAVLDTDNRLVGLLFAGSDNSTIINRIKHVFAALDVNL